MPSRADASVVPPGGIGRLEELFEVWAQDQIEGHRKPIGLLDVDAFFAPLLACVDHVVEQRFRPPAHGDMLIVERPPAALLERFRTYRSITTPKWL